MIFQFTSSQRSDIATLQTSVGTIQNEWTDLTVTINNSTTTFSDGRPALVTGLLTAKDTPLELLTTTAGNYIEVDTVKAEYKKVTADYTIVGVSNLQLTMDGLTVAILDAAMISNGDTVAIAKAFNVAGVVPLFGPTAKLLFAASGANPAVGTDSILTLKIRYKLVALS